jgi:copper chaperone CopZ
MDLTMKLFPIAISLALFSNLASADVRIACFKTEGMVCDACARGITSLLMKQRGIKSADTSYPDKRSFVTYESKDSSPEKIKAHIKDAGYESSLQDCKDFKKK